MNKVLLIAFWCQQVECDRHYCLNLLTLTWHRLLPVILSLSSPPQRAWWPSEASLSLRPQTLPPWGPSHTQKNQGRGLTHLKVMFPSFSTRTCWLLPSNFVSSTKIFWQWTEERRVTKKITGILVIVYSKPVSFEMNVFSYNPVTIILLYSIEDMSTTGDCRIVIPGTTTMAGDWTPGEERHAWDGGTGDSGRMIFILGADRGVTCWQVVSRYKQRDNRDKLWYDDSRWSFTVLDETMKIISVNFDSKITI